MLISILYLINCQIPEPKQQKKENIVIPEEKDIKKVKKE